MPFQADWLKDLSLTLPISVTSPTQNVSSLVQSSAFGRQEGRIERIKNAAINICSCFIVFACLKCQLQSYEGSFLFCKCTISSTIRQDSLKKLIGFYVSACRSKAHCQSRWLNIFGFSRRPGP